MDEPLKPVFPQQPEQIDPSPKQVQTVDKPQTLYLFVILICFFIALSSISFYVLYSKNRIHKDEMMIDIAENEISTQENTINTKEITFRFWTFSIPENWDYIGCKNDNSLFIGESKNGSIGNNLEISVDHLYAFETKLDVSADINLCRYKGLMTPLSTSPLVEGSDFSRIVSQAQQVQIAGQTATVQFEEGFGPTGLWKRWVAYIPYGEGMDVISIYDLSKKDVFDALLQSLSYTNYIPTPTQNPSNTPIPTSIPKQTYINPDGYFTFTYPTTWKVRKTFGPSVAKTTPV